VFPVESQSAPSLVSLVTGIVAGATGRVALVVVLVLGLISPGAAAV
jgi:hypothetical protein